jgi:hypothetical protein
MTIMHSFNRRHVLLGAAGGLVAGCVRGRTDQGIGPINLIREVVLPGIN